MGVSSVDEDTSTSLPKFIDAANDVQSTGTILEDGAAPAIATWGPRRRRGAIWAAPTTAALATSPSPNRAQLRRASAMSHTKPSPKSRAGPNIDVKAPP